MKRLTGILKWMGITLLCLFLVFFVYANWQRPAPGERIYYGAPTALAVLDITAVATDIDYNTLLQAKGISSYTLSDDGHSMAVTYDPQKTREEEIINTITKLGAIATMKDLTITQPQCPVDGYLSYFYRFRYALCLRK